MPISPEMFRNLQLVMRLLWEKTNLINHKLKQNMVCLLIIWAEIHIQHLKAMHFRCSNSNNNLLKNNNSNNRTHSILRPKKVLLLLMNKLICRQIGLIIPCMLVISKIDKVRLRCQENYQMLVWKCLIITNNLFKVNNREQHQPRVIVTMKDSTRIRSNNNFHQDPTCCHLPLANNLTTTDLRTQ